ncbi:hypothetical protein HRbin30_01969 [bacterium HR30]|nr:hypothetical protein HRbin30_01969 [bacterium HR30]
MQRCFRRISWILLLFSTWVLVVGSVPEAVHAFTEETEAGHELDEGLPPPRKKARGWPSQRATLGYDYKKSHRFWRNYKAPRPQPESRKRPKEYIDVE